ncbi:MAG TPA: glycerol-3-phosphate dehydrogenase/oxidase [Candidatus Binatia bacterium]|nr:glycerol-3-phosphate dehydrogenase/oxidase [Candidatus Binatia bacterium]
MPTAESGLDPPCNFCGLHSPHRPASLNHHSPSRASVKRDPFRLTRRIYDVAVIGGGIYGISVARDAALRGLSVAVVEKADFGGATSSNHQRIIHGGLRYLQHADLRRMRESIRERSILLRIAPHLVNVLPFVVPTYRNVTQRRLLMAVALAANDLVSLDRNHGLEPHKKIPRGRMLSKPECLRIWSSLDTTELTGGALFYDAQVYDTNRLNLALLFSAAEAGAEFVNYVETTGFLREGAAVMGVQVKDVLSGAEFPIQARMTVNCAGPWVDRVLELLDDKWSNRPSKMTNELLKSVVLVTRSLVQNVGVGIPGKSTYIDGDAVFKKGYRYFFITPERDRSLVGTFQTPHAGDPDELAVSEDEIREFIFEINSAFDTGILKRKDVHALLCGLVPSAAGGNDERVQLRKRYEIRDHEREDGIHGLLSIAGVKYTTARAVAQKVVDVVLKKLRRKFVRCQTGDIAAVGGRVGCFEEFSHQALKTKPKGVSQETLHHLLRAYGSEYQTILKYC